MRIYGFDSAYARMPWKDVAINEEDSLTESWSGYALVRDEFSTAPVMIPLELDAARPNYKLDSGAIRFWLAPQWSSAATKMDGGPGHVAHLLQLVALNDQKAQGKWTLCVNETGDTLYLVADTLSGPTVLLKAPVEFAADDWRMITLGYSPTNTALWLDNQLIGEGGGLPNLASWEKSSLGLVVGSDLYVSADNVAHAHFEELTTLPRWPKKSDWQDLYFVSGKRRALLGPLGTKEEEAAKVADLKAAGLLPEEYGEVSRNSEEDGPIVAYSYDPGTLWLEITGVSNQLAHLIVHGTVENEVYEILSKEALTNATWVGEVPLLIGAAGQDWTATTIAIGTRTNELFFWAKAWVDTDGDGLPDWWELENGLDPNSPDTGDTGIPDGYKDSDNDGWTNLQEYQNGTNSGQFDTPPPPRNVVARLDSTGTNIIVSWDTGGGAVASYEVGYSPSSPVITQISPEVRTATVSFASGIPSEISGGPGLVVTANFPNNSRASSEVVWATRPEIGARLVRGPACALYVVIPNPPPDLEKVRFSYYEWASASYVAFEVDATNFVNGQFPFPSWQMSPEAVHPSIYCQPFFSDGRFSRAEQIQLEYPGDWNFRDATRADWFVDARPHLKENLRFLLRAATVNQPFGFNTGLSTDPQVSPGFIYDSHFDSPTHYFVRQVSPLDYEYASYRQFSPYLNYAFLMATRPIRDHYLWRNFIFAPGDFTTGGGWTNGVSGGYYRWYTEESAHWIRTLAELKYPHYRFTGIASNSPPAPLAFDDTTGVWIYYHGSNFDPDFPESDAEVGVFVDENYWAHLIPSTRNNYGLPIESLRTGPTNLYYPGTAFWPVTTRLFPEFAQPDLQTVEYYFASQTPFFTHQATRPPLPGSPEFTTTNTSPLLLTGVGQPFTVSGWAKQAILNGYTNKFAYLEQYFDKAFLTTNSVVTTNEAGILSPYGEFFPTHPGRVALVTLPDLDTNERGTAIVHVVSLNVDANHDGVMDRSFFGPDQTSAANPLQFWINNDNDSYNGTEFDANWRRDCDDNIIGHRRDLEDFARLWISGLPALPATNGYTVTLGWRNYTGNPTIKIYPAYEADGGNSYLSDADIGFYQSQYTNAAGVLTGPGACLATNSPSATFTFPANYFATAGRKHFLFEAAGIGYGELVMTIALGTNILAETSVFMDLIHVANMIEQAHTVNVTAGLPPSSSVSDRVIDSAVEAVPGETKQIIIFVHGINNTEFDYQRSTETSFKRLYWSGYRGKVAGFRWPCAYLPPTTANPFQYNKSEFYAFKSGTALKNYLSYLRNNRPDMAGYAINLYAHSQGNVVASEAILQGAPFDNYILTQAAFPAHCYDTNAPTLQKLLDAETNNPTAVQTPFYPTNGGYHGYCLPIEGNLINFFNTNDFALASGTTLGLETNWEENQRTQKPEAFFGGPSYVYNPITGVTTANYPFSSSYTVTDLQEIKALVARSRSKAVGAQGGLHGVIGSETDLLGEFGFGNTRPEHSAQFTRPIQTAKPYWEEVVQAFNPPTP